MAQQIVDTTNYAELQETIIRNVSHELRTPLTIIRVYAELLNKRVLGDLAPEQQQAMNCIVDRALELQNIVMRMGILMTLQSGTGVSIPTDCRPLCEKTIRLREEHFEKAGIEYSCTIEQELAYVDIDPAHLEAAIDCLIENAIKFTESGGKVQIDLYRHGDYICFTVQDTGIGIAQEQFPQIFERFYQIDPSTTRTYGGLGLGLAVVKEVVEAYGGVVEVRSQQGKGSSFTIRLPITHEYAMDDPIVRAFSQYHQIRYD